MKHFITYLIMIVTLSTACKKQEVKPNPQPQPTPCSPVTSGELTGEYKDNFVIKVDTIRITFIRDNCPTKTLTYRISNIGKAFTDWGAPMSNHDYYIDVDSNTKLGQYTDSLSLEVKSNGLTFKYNYKGTWSPLGFTKIK